MSDENVSGTPVPPVTPAEGGGFDWLFESHQQSAPMAPLTDDIPAPAPAPPTFGLPDPSARPAPPATFPGLLAPSAPAQPVSAAPSPFAPPIAPLPAPLPVPEPPPAAVHPVFEPPVTPVQPVVPVSPPPLVQLAPPPPAAQPSPPPPVVQPSPAPQAAQAIPPSPAEQAGVFSFAAQPLAPTSFTAGTGPSSLTLERHHTAARSGNGPLDWIAFVLAFLAPPIGLLLGIAAVITDSRSKGYAAGIAKAAIGIGVALTLVLGVALAVVTKINSDHAAHASIVASSRAWCTKLQSNPATLSSDTFGWPSPGDTIPASITKMKTYQAYWQGLAKVAPSGIRADTQKVVDTAKSIVATVQSTQTLNNAGNIAQLQNVVATSGIHGWVSTYCN